MASMLPSLLQRITELPTKMHQLFRWSPATSSSSSGDSQMVDELKKLRRTMERIRARLSDAEEREFKERSVKLWLDELRGVAYDAEDVIEEVEYEVLRYRVESLTDEDGQIIKRPRTDDASFQHQILAEIQRINEQFSEISEDAENLGLLKEVGKRFSDIDVFERPPSSSLVNEQQVCGRDVDKGKLIQMLLSDSSAAAADGSHSKEGVRVVSIVGMGGLGKTTLAQLVYNANQVKQHFQTRGWVCVSEPFDVIKLTKQTLQAVTGRVSEMTDFDPLLQSLNEELEGKRFLLVLDDVWNENQELWDALWVCLSRGANGSRVLITTRNEKVSRICLVSEPNMYQLGGLSDKDSWSLFEKRAFGDKRSGEYPHLVTIGEKIVERCKGLPLALKTLAGLLFGNLREDTWEGVLKSELWELPEGKDYILPALKLSYHHLPSHIKSCFAFCAVFPKDHRFNKDNLVRMWMAQGYLKVTQGQRMEDVGTRYFDELLQRCFFQTSESGVIVMHDMIHDLALSIWGTGECCTLSDEKLATGKARHLLIESKEDLEAFLSVEASNLKRVRTVVMTQSGFLTDDHIIQNFTDHICSNMKFLRVLDLSNSRIHQMPESVGNLKHLCYLDFSDDTLIVGHKSIVRFQSIVRHESMVLPESIGALLNLQTLRIGYLTQLPQRLTRLINLRHLLLVHGDYLQRMPRGIGQLTQLQTLPLFVVSAEENAAGIQELSTLNHLQGNLRIKLNIVRHGGGGPCILSNKEGLRSLTLDFPDIPWNPQEQQCQEELIGNLQPHTNIRELRIIRYGGGRLPQWLGCSSYPRLEKIVVQGFCVCRDLSTLGRLPFLKTLHVQNGWRSKNCEGMSIGRMEKGAFPSLKELYIIDWYESTILHFQHLTTLKTLSISYRKFITLDTMDFQHLTALTTLEIQYCDKLTTFDLRHLTALTTLDIRYCNELTTLGLQHLTALMTLNIQHCDKLTTLDLQHLTALMTFKIQHYNKLTTLDLQHLTALTTLDIRYCKELTTLDLQHLTALMTLNIQHCDKLTTLDLQHLMALTTLRIDSCDKFTTLDLQHRTTSMRLQIKDCKKLTTLDDPSTTSPDTSSGDDGDVDRVSDLST